MNALNQQVSEALRRHRSGLAGDVVEREFVRHPELEQRYGKTALPRMLEDTAYHLDYLGQALAAESTALFGDYIGWAKVILAKHGVPPHYLATTLESMKESLEAALPHELSRVAGEYLDLTLEQLPQMPDEVPSFIANGTPLAVQYLQALLRGERQIASKLILDAVEQGTSVQDLYLQVFEPTQYEIGRLWQVNQISVAQEHYCTAATQQIMSLLYPYTFGTKKTGRTLVATCVSGDMHEIGARMVCDFFELDGWQTYYLGANVPSPSVVQTLVQYRADLLAVSATITYHVKTVEALIAAVRKSAECSGVKILVGGYPFKIDPDLWRKIGADGSANNAQEAIDLGNRLVNHSSPQ